MMRYDDNDNESYYRSPQQQILLAILPKCTATIGIIGSLFIMKELYYDIKHGESNPIKRVLLGMACYEIISAIGWFLSIWMIPSTTDHIAFAVGTIATCHLQGILLQFSIGAPLYHGIYTYFFFLIIQHDYSTERIEIIEGMVHIIIMIMTSLYAIMMLLMKQYHPLSNGICWIGVVDSSSPDSQWYTVGLFYLIIWIIFVTMISLHWNIRRRLVRTNHPKDDDDVSFMTLQGMYYCVAFVMTWLPMTVWSMKNGTSNGNVGFGWDVLAAFGVPLQGLWNFFIFRQSRSQSHERSLLCHIILCCLCQCRSSYNNDDDDSDKCHDDDDEGHVEVCCHAVAAATSHQQDCCCCADSASITEAETSSHTYTSHTTITTLTTEQHPVVVDRAATINRHHRSHNRTRRTTTGTVIKMSPIDPTQDIIVHFPEA